MATLRGGDRETRTLDLYVANVSLYQLSYIPKRIFIILFPGILVKGIIPLLHIFLQRIKTPHFRKSEGFFHSSNSYLQFSLGVGGIVSPSPTNTLPKILPSWFNIR